MPRFVFNDATYDITIYLRTLSRRSIIFAIHACENLLIVSIYYPFLSIHILSFLNYKIFLYRTQIFNLLFLQKNSDRNWDASGILGTN